MGCNTSQELKTKDGAALDAVSNGEPEPSAPQLELGDSAKSSNNHTNHAKSNSIISNGDAAKSAASAATAGGSAASAAATNGIQADHTEFNDDAEDEGKFQQQLRNPKSIANNKRKIHVHSCSHKAFSVCDCVCVCFIIYYGCIYQLSTSLSRSATSSSSCCRCPAHSNPITCLMASQIYIARV